MYEISGLTKTYKRGKDTVEALRGVDVVIPDGDLLAIQGPTGHGKSTLLQLIGGLDRPTGGSLVFNGRDLAGDERDAADEAARASTSATSSSPST